MQTQNNSFGKVSPILLALNVLAILALVVVVGSAAFGKTATLSTWMRTPQPHTVRQNDVVTSNTGSLASTGSVCLLGAVCFSTQP